MPIDTKHPLYLQRCTEWLITEAFCAGADAVRDTARLFVPPLDSQDATLYTNMINRGVLFNGTAKIVDAFVGMLTNKPVVIAHRETENAPGILAKFLANCDGTGTDFQSLAQQAITGIVKHNRFGILVDWTEANSVYVTAYSALEILNWKTDKDEKGVPRLVLLVLKERGKTGTGDKYAHGGEEQFRELELTPEGVVQTIYQKDEKGEAFVVIDTSRPTRRGAALNFIPFVMMSGTANGPHAVESAIIADILELNKGHFRNSVDLERGLHYCALPTPIACGWDGESVLPLGPTKAWTNEKTDANAKYLEFTGAGLAEIRTAMNDKRDAMAAIGSRVLATQKADTEAFETVALRTRGDATSLITIAEQATRGLSRVCQIAAWIIGTEAKPEDLADEVYAIVNKNLISQRLQPEALRALVEAYMNKAISFQVLFSNLQAGEIIPEGRTMEEEKQMLDEASLEAVKAEMQIAKTLNQNAAA